MSVSVWRDANSGENIGEFDVAIVGGGIAGLSIARQCVKRGLSAAIIEARDLAAGATGRNAGFAMTGLADHYESLISVHGRARARAIWQTSQANLRELVEDVAGREGIECDLVACGSVLGAWSEQEEATIARSFPLLREDGFELELLDRVDVAQRTGSQRFRSGLFVPGDHGVHPVKLVSGLARAVRNAGVAVLEHHEVREIESISAKKLAIRTTRGNVIAARAILATNAYTRQLEPFFNGLVQPVRGQVLATEPVAPVLKTLLYTDDGFQYARQLPDGRLIAGGWRKLHANEEVGYGDEVTDGVQRGIEGFVAETWPALATARITHRWSGVMGFSPDGLPLVGRLKERSNIGFAVGFTGHGLGFALAAARAVVNVITESGDAGIFDFDRITERR